MKKTFSFWTLCLGATALTWDAHAASPDMQNKVLHAQSDSISGKGKPTRSAVHHTAQMPQPRNEQISVTRSHSISHGSEQTVGQKVMQQFVPGTNPLKVLAARTPGLSFSSGDALGLDAWSSSLYMRGFFWNELGMTLDGIPLNDQSYNTVSGLGLSQAIITNNIGFMSVSQGGGAVNVASNTNLGGAIQVHSSDPSDRMEGQVSQMFGSNASFRTYGRFDSGKLNSTGTKFYISYARSDTHKWKGGGDQLQQQAEAKLVQPVGQDSHISAFMNWSNNSQWGYADMSLASIRKYGWRTDDYYPDFSKAYAAAAAGNDDTIYDGGQHQVSYLGGLTLDFALTNNLRWKTIFYGNSEVLYTTYGNPYQPSVNTMGGATAAPFSEQVWQSHEVRYGMTSSVQYNIAHNTIESGIWLENNNQEQSNYFYNEPTLASGAPPLLTIGPYNTYGKAFMSPYGFKWTTDTFQYFLSDVYHPVHNLDIHAGFRSMITTTSGGAQWQDPAFTGSTDPLANGSLTAAAAFLPHVAVNYRFLPGHEVYFDVAENMRGYQVQAYEGGGASPWSVQNQATFKGLQKTLRPERDWVYLVGYRYTSRPVIASIDAYHADAYHRLQYGEVPGSQGLGNIVGTVVDTGHVSIYGVDAALTIQPFKRGVMKGLSAFSSISYNHSTYGSDFPNGSGGYADTRGKKFVNFPQIMYKANITYGYKGAEVHLDANYYSKRYFSYTNDTWVAPYWLVNLGARYRFGDYGPLKGLTFDFSVYNLNNTKYISMMGENGNPTSGDAYSMERGAVRQYFGTISAHFY
ncbi:TonB-dependent receptor [Komagataeibacter swingsii]|uniref:TonB-dependent receptor n=1 Tax=Komagataeibacter swingsii TaxID=215220 RepID=A0A850P7W0_9PROT|nr:TonB-dependent receptor [Komagataeibacter swingsii]AHI25070.1 TonB-dependent receptor [Komagataeibacter xylinus E25]NVN38396.1 TonB-dependent receptor [Komagataeibacter swingsii]RFP05893.1 hypothetical protein BFX83_13135 [Komagataeibacter xylinus]